MNDNQRASQPLTEALGKYEVPAGVPVVSNAGKVFALHPTQTKNGEPRFAMTEVQPARMGPDGRTVDTWTGVYQGVRLTFDTPLQAERFFQAALAALDSLKVRPRAEAPIA